MENQLQHKRNKNLTLPSLKDISKFDKYLKKKIDVYYSKLERRFNFKYWKELASFTLISIQTFNRKRPGEIERTTIHDFKYH